MMKYSHYVFFLILSYSSFGQNKVEREHRILKCQFPVEALHMLSEKVRANKKMFFYQELDNENRTYTAKFKKDRLFYQIDFIATGKLKNAGFCVKEIDIPEESYTAIQSYLTANFEKYTIRQILQLYPNTDVNNLKNVFQNLLTPNIVYQLIVIGKKEEKNQYKITFNVDGTLIQIQLLLPANYDHVLY